MSIRNPCVRSAGGVRTLVGLLALLLLGACAQLPHRELVEGPTSAQPQPPQPPPANGSIFHAAYTKPMFEDRRPRHVGDILTVVLNENLSATKNSEAHASRDGSVSFKPTSVAEALGDFLKDQGTEISGSNDFKGEGGANASNTFNGTITTTVMKVLPNGNLRIAGEKQIGINQGAEFVRFTGIVNPRMLDASSRITSDKVANVRLSYYSDGYIDEAQQPGWLQRVLLNVSPF